jgi:hypothetical protein
MGSSPASFFSISSLYSPLETSESTVSSSVPPSFDLSSLPLFHFIRLVRSGLFLFRCCIISFKTSILSLDIGLLFYYYFFFFFKKIICFCG